MVASLKKLGVYLPGLIASWQVVVFLLNLYLFERLTHTPIRYRDFQMPFWIIPTFVTAGIAYILTGIWPLLPPVLAVPSGNLLIAITSLFFVLGFAVVVHFVERVRLPRLFKYVLYAFFLIQPGPLLVILIGFAEPWVEFRRRFPIIKS